MTTIIANQFPGLMCGKVGRLGRPDTGQTFPVAPGSGKESENADIKTRSFPLVSILYLRSRYEWE
jgi:hypothetical protein